MPCLILGRSFAKNYPTENQGSVRINPGSPIIVEREFVDATPVKIGCLVVGSRQIKGPPKSCSYFPLKGAMKLVFDGIPAHN